MQDLKRKPEGTFSVRRTQLKPIPPEAYRTPLGRRLMEIVAEVDASDDPPMSEDDLEQELQLRRGGFVYNGR